jgi:hypothetical protein
MLIYLGYLAQNWCNFPSTCILYYSCQKLYDLYLGTDGVYIFAGHIVISEGPSYFDQVLKV